MAMIERAAAPYLRDDQRRSAPKLKSVHCAEYNAAVPNLRPVYEEEDELPGANIPPLIVDHVGMTEPHPLNKTPKSPLTQALMH